MSATQVMLNCIRIFALTLLLRYLDVAYDVDGIGQVVTCAVVLIWGVTAYIGASNKEEDTEEISEE